MTDKLIAIVRFKHLRGVRPTTRFAVFRSPEIRCGPKRAPFGCAFYKDDWNCNSACGNTSGALGELSDLYFLRIDPKTGRYVVRRER